MGEVVAPVAALAASVGALGCNINVAEEPDPDFAMKWLLHTVARLSIGLLLCTCPRLMSQVVNGSFESGLTGWVASNVGIYVSGPPADRPTGTHGTHAVNLGVFSLPGSYVGQWVSVAPSTDYSLLFDFTANANGNGQWTGRVRATVFDAAGKVLNSDIFSSTVPNGFLLNGPDGFTTRTVSFRSPASLALLPIAIRFDDVSDNGGQAVDVVLDNVRLFSPPVPNTPPAVSLPPGVGDQTIAEDGVAGPLTLVLNDNESPATQLSLSGSSSNPALVRDEGIVFEGSGVARTVRVFPQANQYGTARITVIVRDSGGLTGQTTFNLTVQPVNDAPVIGGVADMLTTVGRQISGVRVSVSDVDTARNGLVLSGKSSNQELVLDSNILLLANPVDHPEQPGSQVYSLVVKTEAGRTGSTRITLGVSDGTATAETSFNLEVRANTPPRIAPIASQQVLRNTPIGPLAVTVNDDETPGNLLVDVRSSNTNLIPATGIFLNGTGANRSLTLTPAAGATGGAVITITAGDGELSASTSFEVTVTKPNTPPVISAIADQLTKQGVAIGPVAFTVQDDDTPAAQLVVQATSSNGILAPSGNITLGGEGTNRTVTITPAAGQTGTAAIQLSVSDGSLSTSRQFLVTVTTTAERQMLAGSATGGAGSTVTLPVTLVALGGENAAGFSLGFDALALNYQSITMGSNAGNASVNVNSSRLASGQIGFTVGLPSGQTFGTGARHLLNVTFRITSAAAGTYPITFLDQPVAREVVDAGASSLATGYSPGLVTVTTGTGYEGDAAPRPNGSGNGTVTVADWVQVGRYAAGLDTVTPGAEFQRVDCAPRMSGGSLVLGNGAITVADWVQAGRYAAGLDPITLAGGPTGPVGPASVNDDNDGPALGKASVQSRQLRLVPAGSGSVAVELTGQGIEAGLAFSVGFDASTFRFTGARLADGVSGVSLQVNDLESALGRVGLALTTEGGKPFTSGTIRLVILNFAPLGSEGGPVTFGDAPVRREVVDALADALPASYENGVINLVTAGAGGLRITQDARGLVLRWPASGGATLEQTSDLRAGSWQPASGSPVINGADYELRWPGSEGARFFRWRKP